MDKSVRRKRRKEKERQRNRRRTLEKRSIDNVDPAVRGDLLRLYAEAQSEFPLLVGVFELDSELQLSEDEMLRACGLGERYKTRTFNTVQDDGYSNFVPVYQGNLSQGGHTQIITDQSGQDRTIVFMKRSAKTPHLSDRINVALFLHELGHVADFHRSVNWSAEKPVDLEAMELYAHEFACRRLMDGGFVVPLAFYIEYALAQLAAASVESISNAAKRFKESALYAQCEIFIRPAAGVFKRLALTSGI